jgi:DNA-binding cell septation regulator SpoVG
MKNKKFINIVVATMLFCFSFLFSQETSTNKNLWVTSVEKTGSNEYSITLNDLIVIKEVKVKKTKIGQREIVNLEFPTYISKRGKTYPQITVLDKTLQERIIKAITSLTPEKPTTKVEPRFKINKFSPYTHSTSSLKVFASVVFEDSIEIECKVMKGKYGPWISWPARKDTTSGKWIQQVSFTSKEYKKKIEQALLSKYNVKNTESPEE